MKYYTNRELARFFNINLAKWKRWSREFLPPDPLGGLQSGYARQYHQDDAFTVYLGGHLVADLRYSIPDAKRILSDLSLWLAQIGYYENAALEGRNTETIEKMVKRYHIYVQARDDASGNSGVFSYTIRGIISEKKVVLRGYPVQQIQFTERVLLPNDVKQTFDDSSVVKLLSISDVYDKFRSGLNGEGRSEQ